jgi:hypothetical protein
VRKIVVTSALPYANGPIHLGHLVRIGYNALVGKRGIRAEMNKNAGGHPCVGNSFLHR